MDRRVFFQQLVGTGFIAASLTNELRADSPRTGVPTGAKVKWQTNLKAAQKLALQQNKPILILFGATWCPPCRKLENETLSDRRTVAMIDREFISVHLDYDKEPKIVKILEVERLPCLVIITPEADLLHKSEGFAEAKEFQAKLTSALEKRRKYNKFKPPLPQAADLGAALLISGCQAIDLALDAGLEVLAWTVVPSSLGRTFARNHKRRLSHQ